jgi:glycine hydroxymethyltransferase
MTTRGVKEDEVKKIVEYMDEALKNKDNEEILSELRNKIREISLKFPVPGV